MSHTNIKHFNLAVYTILGFDNRFIIIEMFIKLFEVHT